MENIIIGSGPAGRVGSLQLGKLGKEVLIIEKDKITGTCLNEGCMVVCALTEVTKFLETNNIFNKRGFLKSQMELSYEKIVEQIEETQKLIRKINQSENEAAGNEILYGEATIEDGQVKVKGESFDYENLLIASGARPFIPDIPGKEYGLTNKDVLKLDDVPEKLNMIGGGIIATEIANIYSKLGSEVNIFARSTFLKNFENSTKDYIYKHLIPEINVYENTDIVEVGKNSVTTGEGETFEGVPFFATGRSPNSEFVKDFVELNPNNTIKVNERMQTSVENVYAAGDVIGGYMLTPVARMEGIVAARNMSNYPSKVSYNVIPQTLSLNMEVSAVEDERLPQECKSIEVPGIGGPGAFWNILDGETGYTKVSFNEKENKIKRINSISPSSVSDVAYLSYLMRMNYDLDDYDDFIEIHPSTDANYKIIKNMWL